MLTSRENRFVDEKPFDEGDVRRSVYEGVFVDEEQIVKSSAEWLEWNKRTNHIQEWFIRCSWTNKYLFLKAISNATEGCFVTGTILKCLNSVNSKDVTESFSSYHAQMAYDAIPQDDDRVLPIDSLKTIMKKDLDWFGNLKPIRQVSVILRLLRLGGGGLVYSFYKYLRNVDAERRNELGLLRKASSDGAREAEEIRQKPVDKSRVSASKQNVRFSGGDSAGSKQNSLSDFTGRKLEELAKRETELLNYKRARGIENGNNNETSKTSKKAAGDAKEVMDYLQIMPIHLNRRIMAHVDEKTLSGYKKVGRYWGKMIDESINEKSGRRAINAKINKIIGTKPESRRMMIKKKEEGDGGGRGGDKVGGDEDKAPNKEEEEEDDDERKKDEFKVEEDDDGDGEWTREASESEKKEFLTKNQLNEDSLDGAKTYEKVFSKKFKILRLDKSGFNDRCCCWNEKVNLMACSTASNVVYFYSMRTGAELNFSVFGFDSLITCLCLDLTGNHVIVGCSDGTLVSKIARRNETNAKFHGNVGAVNLLFSTSTHLMSSSSDHVIRYYQLWSGVCLLCMDLSNERGASSILMTTNIPLTRLAAGTKDGVLILLDGDQKTLVRKSKIHRSEITALNQRGYILVTASANGKIRIWNLNQLEINSSAVVFYGDITVPGNISSLFVHCNQVAVAGLENGTVKIVSLAGGKTLKTLKLSSRVPVHGLAVAEDRFALRVVVWHEEGVEMRVFSLMKSFSRSPVGKTNPECGKRNLISYADLKSSTDPTDDSSIEIGPKNN